MATLHILNKSPANKTLINSLIIALSNGDSLLVIEDGIYAATHSKQQPFSNLDIELNFFALEPDIKARGMEKNIISIFKSVNYRQFVNLCSKADKVISWF